MNRRTAFQSIHTNNLPTPPTDTALSTPQTNPSPNTRPHGQHGQSDTEPVKDPTTFTPPHLLAPMVPNPPNLKEWRDKFFNIKEPLLLSTEQYLTYFPHIDNVYSHRSTQKYKRKPFVSHYWDCRLKGRPTGAPLNRGKKTGDNGEDIEKRKRKRKVRERDLCDVKIKVTEFFGKEELEALRKLGLGPDATSSNTNSEQAGEFTFMLDGGGRGKSTSENVDMPFGVLEPTQKYPQGHPGEGGRRWYMVQRVSGNDKETETTDDHDLDHKHTLEESDRIKKNSVQRWMLAREKEKKKASKAKQENDADDGNGEDSDDNATFGPSGLSAGLRAAPPPSRFHASGFALQTLYSHSQPTSNNLTFFGNSFCPFAQRVWIALELIGVPYRYVEVSEHDWTLPLDPLSGTGRICNIPDMIEVNPESNIPCIRHNNFGVWESLVILEYLEDLAMGHSLFVPAVGNAQLKAHSRLWVDFINRRILPVFYALLLTPEEEAWHNRISGTASTTNMSGPSPRSRLYETETLPPQRPYLPSAAQCDPSSLPPQSSAYDIASTTPARQSEKTQTLITTLLSTITTLVNASHRTGPFFLGPSLSYVDIAFAPWIIRLSRVLSYYRGFPRPEVGTRWQQWCDAIENNEVIKRTISEENSYREVYRGAQMMHNISASGGDQEDTAMSGWEFDDKGWLNIDEARKKNNVFAEMKYARSIVQAEGFGLGGDVWGRIAGRV